MLRIENDLRHAFVVAQVDEYQTAVIAAAIDPAAKLGDLARIACAQGAARKVYRSSARFFIPET